MQNYTTHKVSKSPGKEEHGSHLQAPLSERRENFTQAFPFKFEIKGFDCMSVLDGFPRLWKPSTTSGHFMVENIS